jgi:phosphoribosyl-AMP cyclohydrolase / phosphoribosyl-ATP pyrophosphohydrolase
MKIDFKKGNGLVPAIIQDSSTNKVLMLGYMNEEALQKTMAEQKVTFYSRTKERLWTKGETSGNFLIVKEIIADCDQDTLLIKAEPKGPTCHTGADTCFDESNGTNALFLHYLQYVIKARKTSTADKSYTRMLFDRGINKIAQKVGEEAVELVIEAKDSDPDLFKNEAADLLFHLLVLLEAKEVKLEEVMDVLRDRHKQ